MEACPRESIYVSLFMGACSWKLVHVSLFMGACSWDYTMIHKMPLALKIAAAAAK